MELKCEKKGKKMELSRVHNTKNRKNWRNKITF